MADNLTEGERRIVDLVARGLTTREIAATDRWARTVEWSRTNVCRKLGVRSRTELVVKRPTSSVGN